MKGLLYSPWALCPKEEPQDLRAHGPALLLTLVIHAILIGEFVMWPGVGATASKYDRGRSTNPVRGESPLLVTLLPAETTTEKREGVPKSGFVVSSAVDVSADISSPAYVETSNEEKPEKIVIAVPQEGDLRRSCEVHVHQNPHGAVQAVDFGECTPDDAWQKTILLAIQRSTALMKPSPLGVFPPVRTFRFESDAISTITLAEQLSEGGETE
jgi:hypothetical protein